MDFIEKGKYGVDWDDVAWNYIIPLMREAGRKPNISRSAYRLSQEFEFCRLPNTILTYVQPLAMDSHTPHIYPQMMAEAERGTIPMAFSRLGQMVHEAEIRPLAIKSVTIQIGNEQGERYLICPEGTGYKKLPRGYDMLAFDHMYFRPESYGVSVDDQKSLWMPFLSHHDKLAHQYGVLLCPQTAKGIADAKQFLSWCHAQYLMLKNQNPEHRTAYQAGLTHMDRRAVSAHDLMAS